MCHLSQKIPDKDRFETMILYPDKTMEHIEKNFVTGSIYLAAVKRVVCVSVSSLVICLVFNFIIPTFKYKNIYIFKIYFKKKFNINTDCTYLII